MRPLREFELPPERIAQRPRPRGRSRLLVLKPDGLEHQVFYEIVEYFRPEDVLVLNDTRVIPARLLTRRPTGARVELLVTRVLNEREFWAIAGPARKAKGELLVDGARLEVLERQGNRVRVRVSEGPGAWELLKEKGEVPLPPYIKRQPEPEDAERYQTVFAREPGSVAAPTAGLHFTPEILDALREKGVKVVYVTLHVGPGTFLPVRDLDTHRMEEEYYRIPPETQEAIRDARRVFACGTTVVRALETWRLGEGPAEGWTGLFIRPGFEFRVVKNLITNFHMPDGTPILLAEAFAGRERLLKAYEVALREGYLWGSYGDAMLILRKP